MAHDISEDLELSKENVQPILKGRKPNALLFALQPASEDEFLKQQHVFEQDLRTYGGKDPLSLWVKYITWVEQHSIKGGHKGNLSKIVQQCLTNLMDRDIYCNDERFVDIWLKFAAMSQDPLEVYNSMHVRNIATTVAKFYTVWSWELEQVGNLKKADEVLLEGIRRKAQPNEDVKSAHMQLEMRMAKSFASVDSNSELDSRLALMTLRPTTKKKVPVARVVAWEVETDSSENSVVQQERRFIQPRTNVPSRPMPFSIHNPEIEPSWLAHEFANSSSTGFPIHADVSKENDRKPSKWNKVKVKTSFETPRMKFSVHFDECSALDKSPIMKKVSENSGVLSCQKKLSLLSTPVAIFNQPNTKERHMYDEFKVYGGAEEFSFEEIRAAAYWKRIKQEIASTSEIQDETLDNGRELD